MDILVCCGAGFIGSAFIKNYLKNNPNSKIINLDFLKYLKKFHRELEKCD